MIHTVTRYMAIAAALTAFLLQRAPAGDQSREPVEVAVSADRALQIVAARLGEDAEVVQQALRSKKRGVMLYQFIAVDRENRIRIDVDANTGEVTKLEKTPINRSRTDPRLRNAGDAEPTKISQEAANKMATEMLGGGTITDSKQLRKKGGATVYELKVFLDGAQYNITIDANSGEILKAGEESRGGGRRKGSQKLDRNIPVPQPPPKEKEEEEEEEEEEDDDEDSKDDKDEDDEDGKDKDDEGGKNEDGDDDAGVEDGGEDEVRD